MRSTLLPAGRKSDGFSLIEVIVALVILSVGVVALVDLFSSSLRTVRKSEDYSRALLHARALLDEAYASSDIEGLDGFIEFEDGMSAERTAALVSTVEGGESVTETSLGNPAPVEVSIYEIRVRVSWPPSGSLELSGTKAVYEGEE